MALTEYQVLDRVIEANGGGLGAKSLAGGKVNNQVRSLLDSLWQRQLLEHRAKKYFLTSAGRTVWEKEAPQPRRNELRRREEQPRRRQLLDFLKKVEAKGGKAFKVNELRAVPEAILGAMRQSKLVEEGPKEGTFRLTPAGQFTLLAERPVAEQLQYLRQLHRESISQWQAAQKRRTSEVEGLEAPAFEQAHKDTIRQVSDAGVAYDRCLEEMSAVVTLTQVARNFRDALERDANENRQRTHTAAEQAVRLKESVQRDAAELRDRIVGFEVEFTRRLDEIERRLAVTTPLTVSAASTEAVRPSEDKLWQHTRKAFDSLRSAASLLGGFLKVPDLTDAIRRTIPAVSAAQDHALLKKWESQERLTLQVCNDRRLEPRAQEGIEFPDGLLFYVSLR